jgi:hypothetical protein
MLHNAPIVLQMKFALQQNRGIPQQYNLALLQCKLTLRHGKLLCCNASLRCSRVSFRGEREASVGVLPR